MPGYDKTGPQGEGSQTGRKAGQCNPRGIQSMNHLDTTDTPKGLGRGKGRGLGNGKGAGRGLGKRNGRGNT